MYAQQPTNEQQRLSGSELWATITDAAGNVVSSFGTNTAAVADNNAAISAYNQQAPAIIAQNAALEAEERKQQRQFTLALSGIALIVVLALLYFIFEKK